MVPTLLFLGAKAYAIIFYHYMEFSHETLSPAIESVVPYFYVEGPYLVAMAIVFYKSVSAFRNDYVDKRKRF